ncbi:MAG: helix-turn-helix transcriptional regulator [Clostridia bacterium]|nr:helix-turn-helix transcriptional regulator [Clostridia bacterium]
MEPITLSYYNHHFDVCPRHVTRRAIRYYDLTIVLRGVLYYVDRGATVELGAGDFILIRPGEVRQRLDSTIVSEYVSFNFTTDLDLSAVPTVTRDAQSARADLLITACDGFLAAENAHEKIAYVLGALLLLIRDNVSNAQKHPLALEIKNYLLQHYAEKITLESISERFHFSVSYCNNVFKKEMKRSIVDYVIEERMRKAKELLAYTDYSLPEIAVQVGYEDYNYFSRQFKKHAKITPTQYRARFSGK